jgi:hypothetical protein
VGKNMKKSLFVGVLFFVFIWTTTADELAELLQDLAIQTACLGQYSSREAGILDYVTNRYVDPPDWYTPPMMADRFAEMSGTMTRTITFYGICFDYAQFAWDDIKKYQSYYNAAGMKDLQWYIAVAYEPDPNTIILYDPVSQENSTWMLNGVPVREHARYKVLTHDRATGHGWLWVQHTNGTWYWIDPTWTDNSGYPWWGIVETGKEVQYYPNPSYCLSSNSPKPGETKAERETRSPNSTYAEYVKYAPQFTGGEITGLGYYVGYISAFDFDFANKFGFTFGLVDYVPFNFALLGSLSIDYLVDQTEPVPWNSFVFGLTFGVQMFSHYVLYAGGGIGSKYPIGDEFGWDKLSFEWKVNGGLQLQYKRFFTKFDVSYGTIIGPSLGIGIGIILDGFNWGAAWGL